MTENNRERNLEYGLYALAFGLALAIRLLRLGELPLGDEEARWAMQALNLTRGLKPILGPQPAYVMLTSLAIFILQASNFATRLVPALFGALLTLAPYGFRDRLGSKAALVLAFFLAFDPGFLAFSRLAGSPILVVVALLFAWSFWRSTNRNVPAAGISIGLTLLSGPALWPGLLGLGIAFGLSKGIVGAEQRGPRPARDGETDASADQLPVPGAAVTRSKWLILSAYALGTYVLLGSAFLLPAGSGGLSAGLASIPAYFGGWLDFTAEVGPGIGGNVPVSRLLTGLVTYELLALVLALLGLVRGILRRDELVIKLGLWLGVSLILALAYPSRQMFDLAWVLVPLLALAAVEVSTYMVPIQDGNLETIGMAVFTASMLIFATLNYSAIALTTPDPAALQLRWWMFLGALGLLAISIGLVAFGWSYVSAIQGAQWGTLVVLAFISLSMAIAAAGLRTARTVELWPTGAYTGQAQTLISQMNDLSRWKAGVNSSLDVTIAGVDSPALLWALRDWNLTVLDDANLGVSGTTPSVVIASDQFVSTDIESTYRGQDLSWRVYPLWNQGLMSDWFKWSIMHVFPQRDEKIILWVRSDVFIDSQNGQ
ncbi:MAG: hypothetical protein WCK35_26190 [Chloroflexota bacterium]